MNDEGNYDKIAAIAREIARNSQSLVELSRDNDASKIVRLDAHTIVPSDESRQISQIKDLLLSLTDELDRELKSPTDFLYELVACNWDKGALYCLLEHNVFEMLPETGTVNLEDLVETTSIPPEKLLPILRLSVCNDFIEEPIHERFQHGAVSRHLVRDPGLKAFIGFQLYETRVASAHLADSLKTPNPTWTGQSAFKYAWGESMYDWHKSYPEKGARFRKAMAKVSESLDIGVLIHHNWIEREIKKNSDAIRKLVDITRFPSSENYDYFISQRFPKMTTQNYLFPAKLEDFDPPMGKGDEIYIYILNSILWNFPDEDCVSIIRLMVEILEKSPNAILLVNDLLSPPPGCDSSLIGSDKAYRRRDVTVMTMHNAKMRTQKEWRAIFLQANPDFKIGHATTYSSHSCRGLWELTLKSTEPESCWD